MFAQTNRIIPINLKDTNYIDLELYVHDTTTKDNWKISYAVKDDSTRYKDIYIKCAKGKSKYYYRNADVLLLRRDFIPQYRSENNRYIFFEMICATECNALLIFDKKNLNFTPYLSVIDYSNLYNQIVFMPASTKPFDKLTVKTINLNSNQTKIVSFKNICSSLPKELSITKVNFDSDSIKIMAKLIDAKDKSHTKEIEEELTITFKK